jgi:hypothetical protein
MIIDIAGEILSFNVFYTCGSYLPFKMLIRGMNSTYQQNNLPQVLVLYGDQTYFFDNLANKLQ